MNVSLCRGAHRIRNNSRKIAGIIRELRPKRIRFRSTLRKLCATHEENLKAIEEFGQSLERHRERNRSGRQLYAFLWQEYRNGNQRHARQIISDEFPIIARNQKIKQLLKSRRP